MSRTSLPAKYLDKVVSIYNIGFIRDDVGEKVTNEVLLYSDIPINIQIEKSLVEYKLQGLVHYQTHKGYLNAYNVSSLREIEAGYIVFDTVNLVKYLVLGVERQSSFNVDFSIGGYYKLKLEQQADQDSYFVKMSKNLQSKANLILERSRNIQSKANIGGEAEPPPEM